MSLRPPNPWALGAPALLACFATVARAQSLLTGDPAAEELGNTNPPVIATLAQADAAERRALSEREASRRCVQQSTQQAASKSRRIGDLEGKLAQLTKDMKKQLHELRTGQLCSQCRRPASEIEKGEPFQQHLKNVKGVAISGAELDALVKKKRDEFLAKLATTHEKLDSTRRDFEEAKKKATHCAAQQQRAEALLAFARDIRPILRAKIGTLAYCKASRRLYQSMGAFEDRGRRELANLEFAVNATIEGLGHAESAMMLSTAAVVGNTLDTSFKMAERASKRAEALVPHLQNTEKVLEGGWKAMKEIALEKAKKEVEAELTAAEKALAEGTLDEHLQRRVEALRKALADARKAADDAASLVAYRNGSVDWVKTIERVGQRFGEYTSESMLNFEPMKHLLAVTKASLESQADLRRIKGELQTRRRAVKAAQARVAQVVAYRKSIGESVERSCKWAQ